MEYWRACSFAFLVLLSVGCRKDKDETAPSVRILLPSGAATFSIPDTIVVRAEVSDDVGLESLLFSIEDANGAPITSAAAINMNGSSGTFERELIVNNERLLSGSYTIVVRASDGANDGRAFKDITLLEIPLRLRSIFLAPPFGTTAATIKRVDSLGAVGDWTTVQDLNGVAVDSYSQHLLLAGSQFAPFQAVPTSASSRPWQFSASTNDVPEQFTAVTVDPSDRRTYFSTRDGMIRGFTGDGAQQFTSQCLPGNRCEEIVVMGNVVATWQRAIVGGAAMVVTYSIAGTVLETLPVEHERIALFQRTDQSLLLFANEAGTGLIEDLNVSAGGSPEVRTFPDEAIRAVARLDANTLIIALLDRLVRFNYSTNTVSTVTTGIAATSLVYDPATGALFAAQGTDLLTIDPNSGMVTNTLSTGNTIGHILPLRNR